jgi:hypothetical protein
MAIKIRRDLNASPINWTISAYHYGDFWPNPAAQHICWVYRSDLGVYPPWCDAAIWSTAELLAWLELNNLIQLPLIIQDLCWYCHPDRYGPSTPRYGIYEGEPPPIIVPVIIGDWVWGWPP